MSDNNDKLLNYEGLKYYDEKIKEEIVNSGIGSIIDDSSINDANKTWSAKKISESVGVGKAGTGENSEIFNNYKDNDAYGKYSHAEGLRTHANDFSHAEGLDTQASGDCSHAEGSSTIASGNEAHAEGMNTTASGVNSHAEGYMTIASNIVTHAGGTGSEASKEGSFAHGQVVKASSNNYEVAFGAFNKSNTDTLFSVGNGTDEDTRSNAFEITKTTGKLFDKEIATKEDIPSSLPANGGNAATLGGMGASDFAQSKVLKSLDDINNINLESGIYSVEGVSMKFSDSLTSRYYVLIVNQQRIDNGYGTQIGIPFTSGIQRGVFYRIANASEFTEWKNIGDGGTAIALTSPSNKAMLWEDTEGGNLRLTSPDGNHFMEVDGYSNAGFRFCFSDNGAVVFPANYNSDTQKFNINGDAGTINGHTVQSDVPANAKFTDTNTTYSAGTGISISGTTISNSGVRSVASGSSNGTISVNTGGKAANVAVKGLASAAYQAVQTAAGTVGLHRISSGTAAATTTNCPAGCWYGQYE